MKTQFTRLIAIIGVFFIGILQLTQEVKADSIDYINDMVIIEKGPNFSEERAQNVIDVLSKVDEELLRHMYEGGGTIYISDIHWTELEDFQVVNEADEPILTDGREDIEIKGVYLGNINGAYVSIAEEDTNYLSTALHEIGHAIDYALGENYYYENYSDNSTEIAHLIATEKQTIYPMDRMYRVLPGQDNPYRDDIPEGMGYLDEPTEYFANIFADYYLSDESNATLLENGPQTYEFVQTLINRVMYVSSMTTDEIVLNWYPIETTASYNIYQDGELIDTVFGDTAEYRIPVTTLPIQDYIFTFEALDDQGNIMFESTPADTLGTYLNPEALEASVAEAETLQTQVEDDLDYIGYALDFAYDDLDEYYSEDFTPYDTLLSQSDFVNSQYEIEETIKTFEEDPEYGMSVDNANSGVASEETLRNSSILVAVLLIAFIVIIILIVVFVARIIRKRRNTD